MKTRSFRILHACLAAAIVSPAFAVEAPADDAPPPPRESGRVDALPQIKLPPPSQPKASAPFLGVISSEVPDMLADHLGLGSGDGVVIRSLVPGGPAEKGGVRLNDIILKIAGESVGNAAELTQRIIKHKPGDTVSLELIQKGKTKTVDVVLGVKPPELAAAELQPLQHLDMEALPRELADRVRDAVSGNLGGLDIQHGQIHGQIPPNMEEAIREMQKRVEAMTGAMALPNTPRSGRDVQVQGESVIRMQDQEGSVEVKSKDGAKEVTIRNSSDEVIWTGPWNTAQDQAAAPAEIRERIDSLNLDSGPNGHGLRLKMGPRPLLKN